MSSLTAHLTSLEDPRTDHAQLHEMSAILVIAVCSVICGVDGWVGIERFENAKIDWLRTFLELRNGIPSHDSCGRIFARSDSERLQSRYPGRVNAIP